MSRKAILWAMALVVIVPALIGGGYWIWWDQVEKYAPVTLSNPDDVSAIQSMLDRVDYVSPNGPANASARWVYLIGYRNCAPCNAYQRSEFATLQAAGVDTRVVMFARPDDGAQKQSTPEERSTIAELWLNRSWPLYLQWFNAPEGDWKATGLPVADDDMARSGVVWASREFVSELTPVLSRNRINTSYPLVIWRDANHQLRVCACASDKAYHFLREDFGVKGDLEQAAQSLIDLPGKLISSATSTSAAPANDGPDGQMQ
ncbi:MAG: hypothetical protein ACTHLA_09200 [Asticcacaulis sp.]|uniref:hypothetical protein n=1 Tax=Asticcacaulis sp. TaxID=1872648 RepID=UPI003F7C6648